MSEMFEHIIASHHIMRNPRMAFFTVLSVALAVAIIVVMMGLMGGFREEIMSTTIENNPHVVIEPKEGENEIHLYRTLSAIVWMYPGVEAVSPRLKGKAVVEHRDRARGVEVVGVIPADEDPLMRVERDLIEGSFMDLELSRYSAVIGSKLAEDIRASTGDRIELIRENRSISLKIAGIVETGTASDKTLVYIPLKTAQDILGKGDIVSEVSVRLSDLYDAPYLAEEINRKTSYTARSWVDINRDILNLLETQSRFVVVFYILIFAIAGFGIANTMIMIITRRTREIGILMAMGATRFSIMKIFILESLILAPPSALIGCILAYIAARLIMMYPVELPSEIYMVSRMTVVMEPEFFLWAVVYSMFVNLVAGLYPAYRASRLDPVEAIAVE